MKALKRYQGIKTKAVQKIFSAERSYLACKQVLKTIDIQIILCYNCRKICIILGAPNWNYNKMFILSTDKSEHIKLTGVFLSGGYKVDAGGFNAAVTENVGEFCNVPAYLVKYSCKQVAQVVGEHFCGSHARCAAETLHFRPYLIP